MLAVGNNYHVLHLSKVDERTPLVSFGEASDPRNYEFATWLCAQMNEGCHHYFSHFADLPNGYIFYRDAQLFFQQKGDLWRMMIGGETFSLPPIIGLLEAHQPAFLQTPPRKSSRISAVDARGKPITFFPRVINCEYTPPEYPDRNKELLALTLTFANTIRAELKLPILDSLIPGNNSRHYVGDCDALANSIPNTDIGEETIATTSKPTATALSKYLTAEGDEFILPNYVQDFLFAYDNETYPELKK